MEEDLQLAPAAASGQYSEQLLQVATTKSTRHPDNITDAMSETTVSYQNHHSKIGIQAHTLKDVTIIQNFKIDETKARCGNVHYFVRRTLSSKFTGRVEILEQLEGCLLPSVPEDSIARRVFVIHGLGGSGKTQVCVKFAELHRQKFWGIFWIDASSLESGVRSFADIAEIGGVDKGSNLEEKSRKGKEWLTNIQEEWLLIVDNADNTEINVVEFFPSGNTGSILVTTRNKECRISATSKHMSCELLGMGIEDGITLLLKTSEKDSSNQPYRLQAKPIVEKLGCFPLALIQAGAVIRQNYWQLNDYLMEYERNHLHLMSVVPHQNADTYRYSVYVTWQVSRGMIENLRSQVSFDALELLDTSSFLHFEDVPGEIFQTIPDGKNLTALRKAMDVLCSLLVVLGVIEETSFFLEVAATKRRKNRVGAALPLLTSYSLISFDEEKNIFSMHRVVHELTRSRLAGQARRWASYLASVALASSIHPQRDASNYEFRRRLYPHVRFYLENSTSMSSMTSLRKAEIADKYAQVLSENGNYTMAETLYRRSLLLKERLSIGEHRDTFKVANDLAIVLEKLGRYPEAVDMSERALWGRKEVLGKDDPQTLESVASFAVALQGDGKYDKAKKVTKELLETRRCVLGNEHHGTIETINNLASLLEREDNYSEASQMSEESLALRKKLLGDDHPDTLESLSNLAFILERQGTDLDAAEAKSREAFTRRVKVLGKEHPDTLTSLSRLALILVKRGNYAEAEAAQRQVLEGRCKMLGPDHPDTFTTFNNLAGILRKGKNLSCAEDMYRKALAGLENRLGSQHRYTLTVETNLALVFKQQRKYEEAKTRYKKVLGNYEQISGLHCPEALACLNNLALVLRSQDNLREAEQLGRQALAGYQKVYSEEHPGTLTSLDNLALTLQKAGKYAEAEDLCRRALKGFEKTLGDDRPDTLETMSHLAYILYRRSKSNYREAWLLYHRACVGYKKLGIDSSAFRNFSLLKEDMKSNDIPEPSPIEEDIAAIPVQVGQAVADIIREPQKQVDTGVSGLNEGPGEKRRRKSDEDSGLGHMRKKTKIMGNQ